MNFKNVQAWHETRLGNLVFALAELALAYAFVSLAIDTGSLWYYALTLLFAIGFLRNFIRMMVYKS